MWNSRIRVDLGWQHCCDLQKCQNISRNGGGLIDTVCGGQKIEACQQLEQKAERETTEARNCLNT